MKIDVTFLPSQLENRKLAGKTVVVIDVLRATSTIATALANGCREVIPILEPADAEAVVRDLPPGSFLQGGERRGLKIPGFDLGNSPREYRPEVVGGKTVVLSTTNGTRAAILSREADAVAFGSLLNARAVADYCRERCSELILACAGRVGDFSLEDTVCAGMMISYLDGAEDGRQAGPVPVPARKRVGSAQESAQESAQGSAQGSAQELAPEYAPENGPGPELTDSALAARLLYERYEGRLDRALDESGHGRYLKQIGLGDDLAACAAADTIPLVPIFRDGRIIRWNPS